MTNLFRLKTLIFIIILGISVSTSQASNIADEHNLTSQLDVAFDAFAQGRYGDAKTIWQRLADKGVASAQINLAALYDSGKGTHPDPAKAAELYRIAASRGNPFAQFNMALMLIEGRGVRKDLQSAENLLKKAADQNMASAHYQLGRLYAGLYPMAETVGNTEAAGSSRFTPNLNQALNRWYEGGLGFEQERDIAGLQKTIEAMRLTAPQDSRIDSLQAKYDRLHQREPEIEQTSPATAFGTAWPLENGYVVTNYHVVAGSRNLTLQATDGRQIKARTVLCDQDNDLALLAVDNVNQLPPALRLCPTRAATGDAVFTMGFPRVDTLGYAPKFTGGIIEEDNDSMGRWNRILTTVSIQPGNSGGPLLNHNGEVVGVVAAMLGIRDDTTGALQVLQDKSVAIKIENLRHLIGQLPENEINTRTISGQGLPLKALRKELRDSVLVVIAQGENG